MSYHEFTFKQEINKHNYSDGTCVLKLKVETETRKENFDQYFMPITELFLFSSITLASTTDGTATPTHLDEPSHLNLL